MKTAYDVIAKVMNLTLISEEKQTYKNPQGIKFYKDNYGFHTTVQYANIRNTDFVKLREELEALKEEYHIKNVNVNAKEKTLLNKKGMKFIKQMLDSVILTPEEKLDRIEEYIRGKNETKT